VLVDRWNRRLIMICADAAVALTTLGLVVLFATGEVQVWHIYLAAIIRSIGGAFHYPAMAASTTLMVPKEQLTRISGLNQTLQGLMGILAPPLGAMLVSIFPTQAVLMIDVITAMIAITPLLFFSIPHPSAACNRQPRGPAFGRMPGGPGLRTSWPGLMAIALMAMMINFLLTPTGALMPLLITEHFQRGALAFGLTDTVWGVGMILGGVILSAWGGFKRKIATSMMGITGIGIGVLLVGLAPADLFPLALAGMFLAGLMVVFANGPLHALFQTVVPAEMQGRVLSLVGSAAMAMSPISLLIAGPVSDKIGIQTWYLVSGVLCIIMALAGFLIPAVMNIENNHRNSASEEAQPVGGLPSTLD
jgi:DHA3 family macrolide efflux protein-like MFS transporter